MMRKAIKCNQLQSAAISCNQRSGRGSRALSGLRETSSRAGRRACRGRASRGPPRPSRPPRPPAPRARPRARVRTEEVPSPDEGGHPMQSEAIRGNQRTGRARTEEVPSPDEGGHPMQSEAISGNQRQSAAMTHLLLVPEDERKGFGGIEEVVAEGGGELSEAQPVLVERLLRLALEPHARKLHTRE